MDSQQLGWGIVGPGRIAATQIAPAIVAAPKSTLISVVSRDLGRVAGSNWYNLNVLVTGAEPLGRSRPRVSWPCRARCGGELAEDGVHAGRVVVMPLG